MTIRFLFVMTTVLLSFGTAHTASTDLTPEQLIAILANPHVSSKERIEAERRLIGRVEEHHLAKAQQSRIGSGDPEAIPYVFRSFKQFVHITPSGEAVMFEMQRDGRIVHEVPGILYSSSGDDPESDAERLPPHAQVYFALSRVWNYLVVHAEPEDRRHEVVSELYDEIETDYQLHRWIDAARWNNGRKIESKLWALFSDTGNRSSVRIQSANTLSTIASRHSHARFSEWRNRILEHIWSERGTGIATELGGQFGGPRYRHPYLSVLRLDWYQRESNPDAQQTRMSMNNVLDRMDSYFGNISGLYEQPRGTISDRNLVIVRQRGALREEARETGDDTKLREFEAEIAEQQRQKLETRIERIDAWIAQNRERLEREAEEYAEQRRLEREREEADRQQRNQQ